jgi:adenylylsulfate reductase subunit A
MANFQTKIVETDVLIIGGGMAATGAAVEAAYWAKKNNLKVALVDKAAMDRSGAVAMGLSALNQYVGVGAGDNTVEDYVRYVRQDLMGITREDLVFNIARHVDSTVHLFEKWGLPIWKDENGKYVHEGRWQVMINGESYKVVVAEAAKNAMNQAGMEIFERVFITEPLLDGDRVAGAVGFSVRDETFYVFKARSVIVAAGGAVSVFRPRSVGEGMGRSWYPPFNSGSSAYMTIKAGAEMTCQEVRFIPVRFKDGYGPVGAWFLLFKATATNAFGEDYMKVHADELKKYAPYGLGKPIPACLRNHLGMMDIFAGKGPLYMQTADAIKKIADAAGDEKAAKKKLKHLEEEAWEDFLDMTVSQAILWAAQNIEPDKKPSEIAPCEPYFIGSHSGASGAWVSGPEDVQTSATTKDYFWGYACMSTVKGMFCAGDASGASSHKFSSGSFTEGRIAAKAAVKYAVDNKDKPAVSDALIGEMRTRTLAPIELFEKHQAYSNDPNINPNFIKPRDYMFRLQKLMDEYAGGVSMQFTTNAHLLARGMELLTMLKEDSAKLAAANLNELMRCWENIHRTWQAEAHVRTLQFREETRWPGYYYRADKPNMDEANWKCFVNCKVDPKTGEWTMIKRPIHRLVE